MRLAFDDCELDLDTCILRRGGAEVHVEPQVFALLSLLARNPDRVFSQDEIIAQVWGGRIVSDSAISSRITAARKAIGDNGTDQRLIRTVRGFGFRFCVTPRVEGVPAVEATEPTQPPDALFGTPSIAVLPFPSVPDDPEIACFADGIVEDLIAALSRFHELAVISRNTSFSFRDSGASAEEIGSALKVKYVLAGNVRHSERRVRVGVELIETATGKQIWSDRYDRMLEDVFTVQDDITAQAVSAIAPQTQYAEMSAAFRKDVSRLNAWERVMRARWHMDKLSRADTDEALSILAETARSDDTIAILHSTAAICHLHRMLNAWSPDPLDAIRLAEAAARHAVDLDANDSSALAIMGLAAMFGRRMDECFDLLAEASRKNPNLAAAYGFRATASGCLGRLDDTLSNYERAIALSPRDPARPFWMSGKGIALFLARRYDACIANADRMLRVQRGYGPALRQKTASLAMQGQMAEARATLAELLAGMPDLTISRLSTMVPVISPDDEAHWLGALRRAGLPE